MIGGELEKLVNGKAGLVLLLCTLFVQTVTAIPAQRTKRMTELFGKRASLDREFVPVPIEDMWKVSSQFWPPYQHEGLSLPEWLALSSPDEGLQQAASWDHARPSPLKRMTELFGKRGLPAKRVSELFG